MNKINCRFNSPFGIYIHIPFCTHKCSYCDFYSQIYSPDKMKRFITLLKKEINIWAKMLKYRRIKTIYFGGGTPGLLSPVEVKDILELINIYFTGEKDIEITLEANPESLTEEKIKGYHQNGINRLSLGIQSFNNKELSLLGRIHSGEKALQVIKNVKQVFNNINLDLIFAIPGQKHTDWQETLKYTVALSPRHISTYNLELHQETPLGEKVAEGKLEKISEEIDARMYMEAVDYLQKSGYEHYEISNFAKPGYESEHNKIYWQFKPYLGLGPAAHSFDGYRRFYNYADLNKYTEMLSGNRLPLKNILNLPEEDLRAEMIIMGLRLIDGLNKNDFYNRFKIEIEDIYSGEINKLIKQGLLINNDENFRLTKRGILLANMVFVEFIPD